MIKTHSAYIGLGSNLNEPAKQLQHALTALSAHNKITQIECSPWYQSRAIGPDNQPDYINAVARIETVLTPEALLATMQAIENAQGRTREIRWGARTLDLDLLLYDQLSLQSKTLTIPHPELRNRSFVLKPLIDLAPALCLPSGEAIAQLLVDCDCGDLTPL